MWTTPSGPLILKIVIRADIRADWGLESSNCILFCRDSTVVLEPMHPKSLNLCETYFKTIGNIGVITRKPALSWCNENISHMLQCILFSYLTDSSLWGFCAPHIQSSDLPITDKVYCQELGPGFLFLPLGFNYQLVTKGSFFAKNNFP